MDLVGLRHWFDGHSWAWWVLGLAFYLVGHGFRAIRLAVLFSDPSVPLRGVLSAHLVAAGVSVFFPFKLGEFFRVWRIGKLAGGLPRGLVVVWLERTFDTVLIAALMLVSLTTSTGPVHELWGPVVLLSAFVLATLVVLGVFPENAESLKLYMLRRYHSRRSLPVLRALTRIQNLLAQGRELVSARIATLLSVSAVVWGSELLALFCFLPSKHATAETARLSVTTLFAQFMPQPMDHMARWLQSAAVGSSDDALLDALTVYFQSIRAVLVLASVVCVLGSLRDWAARAVKRRSQIASQW